MNNGKILLIRTAVKHRRGANNEKIILIRTAAVRIAFSYTYSQCRDCLKVKIFKLNQHWVFRRCLNPFPNTFIRSNFPDRVNCNFLQIVTYPMALFLAWLSCNWLIRSPLSGAILAWRCSPFWSRSRQWVGSWPSPLSLTDWKPYAVESQRIQWTWSRSILLPG